MVSSLEVSNNLTVDLFTFKGLKLKIQNELTVNSYLDIKSSEVVPPSKIKVKELQTLILHNSNQNISDFLVHLVHQRFMFRHLKYLEIINCPNINNIKEYFATFLGHLQIKCDRHLPVYNKLLQESQTRKEKFEFFE